MTKPTRVSHPIYNLLPTETEGFDSLAELALDVHWSWNHATVEVWRQIDPRLGEFTYNPWVLLQTISRDQIERVLADPAFRKSVDGLVEASRQAAAAPEWFRRNQSGGPLTCAACFTMEFMLSETLPIYLGGLGNVAGDQLKAASDLGVPVVGVGLPNQQGYFPQVIDKNGEEQALFPYNDSGQLTITPLRQPNGEWLRAEIALPTRNRGRRNSFGLLWLRGELPWVPRQGFKSVRTGNGLCRPGLGTSYHGCIRQLHEMREGRRQTVRDRTGRGGSHPRIELVARFRSLKNGD